MKPSLDCIPCFVKYSLQAVKMVSNDPELHREILSTALSMASEWDLEQSPPLMAKKIHGIIREKTGIHDPYRKVKDESTKFALEIFPLLKKKVKKSKNSFMTIIQLVAAGNIIDYGASHDFSLNHVQRAIDSALKTKIDKKSLKLLKDSIARARKILYIADNCGEAVFDRLLIEPYREKITFAVRGFPILNDITRREASMSGFDGLVKIIDTGDSTPGVSIKHSSAEFKKVFNESDLIIAKGQGNYEMLSTCDKRIFFLLTAKCPVVAFELNSRLGNLHIIPKNIKAGQ